MAGAGHRRISPPALCLDCLAPPEPGCAGHRVVAHPELHALTIAHVDCDAFFASVEKRDRPELAARPVIVGGGVRGVVTTCCYVARLSGVRSAMPMFKAVRLCSDAVVIRPTFSKYTATARAVRALMSCLTPLVQSLSIDEAVLDMAGTAALHGAPPALVLARFAHQVERELGVTVSIGLARNRTVAKIAAGLDKPRGFRVLGAEAAAVLAAEPVGLLPGIGPAAERGLAARGVRTLADLQRMDLREALRRLGPDGPGLVQRAFLHDIRPVRPGREAKSVSAETTFDADLTDVAELERHLWRLTEKLAIRLREQDVAAQGVVLKLKTARFALRTRAARLAQPTRLPDRLFAAARGLLAREADGTAFRLIGIGAAPMVDGVAADRPDLADPGVTRAVAAQSAVDAVRARFGPDAVGRGRGLITPARSRNPD